MRTLVNVRCRLCQAILPGWPPVQNRPDGAILLHHLSTHHPQEVKPSLQRMETEDIGPVAMEVFEQVGPHGPDPPKASAAPAFRYV